MKAFCSIFTLALLLSCQVKDQDERLRDFDHWALKRLVKPIDVSGLSKRDGCNLNRLVITGLDTMVYSRSELTVLWPIIVRNYRTSSDIEFALINDHLDSVHLVHLDSFRKWFDSWMGYKRVRGVVDDELELIDSVRFFRIKSPDFTFIFDGLDYVPDVIALREGGQQDVENSRFYPDYIRDEKLSWTFKVIEAILSPFIDRQAFSTEVLNYLKEIREATSDSTFNCIRNWTQSQNQRIYENRYGGFLLIGSDLMNKTISIHIIPRRTKPLLFANDAPWMFGDCDRLPN